jgi:hypothetical protein
MLLPGSLIGLGKFYGLMFTVFIPAIFLMTAALTFYCLPQVVGGAYPRCAYLDIEREKMSREARVELLADPSALDPPVAGTVMIDVLFTGGDSVLVRLHVFKSGKDRRVCDISSKIITTKVDCE